MVRGLLRVQISSRRVNRNLNSLDRNIVDDTKFPQGVNNGRVAPDTLHPVGKLCGGFEYLSTDFEPLVKIEAEMREFVKPKLIVSKCLGFAHCRYNGLIISDEFVSELQPHVDFNPVCPEVEIGLGVPREPIRVISVDEKLRLVQPATGRDVTDEMLGFTDSFLSSVEEVDGFILKSRSPSCGIKDVKVFRGMEKSAPVSRDAGFFGRAVSGRFPHLAIEDEGRLTNFRIREHFLAKLFTFSSFREIKASNSMKELVRFHSENKLLLMAYNQKELRILGRITANHEKKPFAEVIEGYGQHLFNAFSCAPRYTSNINVLMHAMGYFSKGLSHSEKSFFLDSLERYRSGKVPLSSNTSILRSWVIRFENEYLMQQTFFEPYPEGLIEITDSGKGRKL